MQQQLYNRAIHSEISKFIGLKKLMETIFRPVRNLVAHMYRINWKIDEDKAIDILISFAHKYLDELHKVLEEIWGGRTWNFIIAAV